MARYRNLNNDWRWSLWHDYQVRINSVACECEDQLNHGHPCNAFTNFRKLKHSACGSAPITALDGSVLSDKPTKLARWMERFCILINRPPAPGSRVTNEAATAAIADPSIWTDPPDAVETARDVRRLKDGMVAGICNIPPEVITAAEPPIQSGLRDLFRLVWKSEEIPGDWRTSIILPQYKDKGSKMECSNFREITLLSVPGKVFAHISLDLIKPLIYTYERCQEQSRFTPGRSTADLILTLGIMAQTRREYHQPLYAAYTDLKDAFDSVDRGVLWKLKRVLGLLSKIISIIEALYSNTMSCVRVHGDTGDCFLI